MKYVNFINKHNSLYNIDQEYTSNIDQFLYENYYDYIMNYTSSIDQQNNEQIDRSLKLELDYTEINELHKNEINTLKELHDKELSNNNRQWADKINIITLNHNNEINKLKLKYENEINDLKSISSIKLGNKAEQDLKQLFINLNKNCIDKHKTNHVCDLWIIDDVNKLLYVIESKNKQKIISDDLIKFKNDLNYIRKNYKEYIDYEIIGLFISTRGDTINTEIGSFSFSFNETYISKQYISEEFFKLYFKSIETLNKIKTLDVDYNNTLNLITNEYKNLRQLIELCESINKNALNIITYSNEIKDEINVRVNDFKMKLIKLNSPDTIRLEIETKIKQYINSNPKFTLKHVKEMCEGYNIFNNKSLTKKELIEWAK